MLISLKNLAKSSSYRTNSLAILTGIDSLSSFPFTTAAASAPTPRLIQPQNITFSFKQWFKSGHNVLLHQIFQILKATEDGGLHHLQHPNEGADVALSHLDLRLTEALVLEVLRYGNDHERDVLSCLKFFDWVGRQHSFRHTRATFNAIFKILSRAKLMSLMHDFLASFRLHRLDHGVRFHDTLVIGYAVSGKPELALELFGKMRFLGLDLDSVGYHVLLNALVEEKCFDAVHAIAQQISSRGYESDITHNIMVKWLCREALLGEAEAYLRRAVMEGNGDGSAVGILIRALCQQDKFDTAAKLMNEFHDLEVPSMHKAYAVWIAELAQAGRLDQALEFLHSKQESEGYIPDVFRYNVLLGKLLKEARLEEVCDLLSEMKEREILPDKVTMNVALCFLCQVGMQDVALELFASRSQFGLTSAGMAYNYLINTFCYGSVDKAFRILERSLDQGYFPGRKTFSILANVLCREGKLDKMKQLVLYALERNVMPSNITYDRFVASLCKTERVEEAHLIYEQLNRIGQVHRKSMYINLINGFRKLNKDDVAARLLIDMQQHGHSPTHRLFRDVICSLCEMVKSDEEFFTLLNMQLSCQQRTCRMYNFFIYGAGCAKRPDLARKVYEMMQASGIEPNLTTHVVMLNSLIKSERYSAALNHFDDLRDKRKLGRRLYSTMVIALCKAKKLDIALDVFIEMRKNVVPNDNCYEFLIQSFCWNKEYDTAVSLVNDIEKIGRRITSFTGNILLLHSLKSPELYQAWVRQREVQAQISDNSILGLLIGAFSGRIWVSKQIENLEEVISNCFPLDAYTYNLLLRSFCNSDMNGACALFDRMLQKGYEPNRWTYDILVQGFLKHGRIAEADRWLKAMSAKGFSPTKQTMMM
ncbi:pentatricopeptide repeat-containing protein At1g71210, mitochondrial [Argentina anserina]|uniref:pentatricopeptide repeat-containing protein At1g71210, mitochondrial n=1 Tax=Argentina anserina TaxID=57926 RepID=UPI002176677E|nr:pentatricopeptide repeat-containing protein At1g71210, mitochondrial [Potentilla anserina]XP_050367329.1 pentatricopeptide repeat-containing protein At1g71210, mitochondrial [Potentilla anserina]XP_050367330.1 pentatricopeptide repeat-containing protein At1g71210, mitochondrial [Potentilla anserina]XP_050367331.1 pentatricopeptide repeat-containing protein At1g71210, mitochondrial [Potentilla anserina]